MKHLKLILGASLVTVVIAAMAADQPAPQPFKIEVQLAGAEVKMRCVSGCYWVTTAYSCAPAKSCSFNLDESGVNGTVPPAAQ